MSAFHPSPYQPPPPQRDDSRSARSWVWALAPLFTVGFANPVVFLIAALRRRTRSWWLTFAGYTALLYFGMVFIDSSNPVLENLAGTSAVVGWFGGTVHTLVTRRRVYPPPPQQPVPTFDLLHDPALLAAMEAKDRRAMSRNILASDPSMALDLAIGRPDLGRAYDDGGLVDVNGAPTEVLQTRLGIDAGAAARIITAREAAGGFTSVDELTLLANLPPDLLDQVRDRAIFRPR